MKKIGLYLLLAIFTISFTSGDLPNKQISDVECDTKALKKAGISELNPFYYSSSKVTKILYDYKPQRKEIEVPLFKGESYRMVFNRADLPKNVEVKIYDKNQDHAGREPIFSSEGNSDQILSFEPKKSKKLYVNYMIPAAKGEKEGGCLVFILGYQLTFITDKEAEKADN